MAHTLTYSASNYRFTVKVNGNAVDSPYQLTNGDVITLEGESYAWDSGTPLGDQYTSWNVSANGTDIGNQTLSLSGDINIVAEEITGNDTSPQPFSATINYTESTTPTLTFKHFYDSGLIGTGTVKFRHYSQQEPSTGETWVLNETFDSGGREETFTTSFVSNGTIYTSLSYGSMPRDHINYGETNVYFNGAWNDQAYRTITFATPPTGDLLTWLQANGTKQGGAVTEHHLNWENNAITGLSVNGVGVQNGYLLKNGDVITFQPAYELTDINHTTYAYSDGEEALTFTITNEDIVIKQGGTLPAKTASYYFTITYQQ